MFAIRFFFRCFVGMNLSVVSALKDPSARAYPVEIGEWDYPADHQIRRVVGDGYIKWRDGTIYLSEAVRKETIALAQHNDSNWAIRFRNFDLGTLTDEGNEIRRSGLVRLSQARPQAAM